MQDIKENTFKLVLYKYNNDIRIFVSPENNLIETSVVPSPDMTLVCNWDVSEENCVQCVTSVPYPKELTEREAKLVDMLIHVAAHKKYLPPAIAVKLEATLQSLGLQE